MQDSDKRTKVIRTALDALPYGEADAGDVRAQIKAAKVPEGVSRKAMLRDVILIAWPSLVELILTQLTSMADQVMVGRLPGEMGITALSAVGLAAQPKFLLMTMIQAMNVGSTAIIARFRGQNNREKANQVFRQAILLNILMSALFMVIGLTFSEQLIRFMAGEGISDTALRAAVDYLNIQIYGLVPLAMTFTVTAALRGVGDARTPMIYNTVANVVNLIFNYIMIYGHFGVPMMGVRGASWATVIGQMVAFFMAMRQVIGETHYISVRFHEKFRFDMGLMRSVVNIGLPSMIEQLFMRAGIIIFTRTVAGLGDTLYATHQICMSIQALSFMMGQAFANATTTLMGQSLGKRRVDMAAMYMRYTRRMGMAVSLVLAALLILFNRTIIGFYNSTPEVVDAGSMILYLIAASQPMQSSQFIVSGGLRGAGDTRYTAMVIAITTLGIRALFGILFINVLKMGLWGAWIALMSDQAMRTVLMLLRYNTGKWAKMGLEARGAN